MQVKFMQGGNKVDGGKSWYIFSYAVTGHLITSVVGITP